MKIIGPEGLKEIKAGDVGHCVCSNGSAAALEDGFWHNDCGSQCSYGSTNSAANYDKAHNRTRETSVAAEPSSLSTK